MAQWAKASRSMPRATCTPRKPRSEASRNTSGSEVVMLERVRLMVIALAVFVSVHAGAAEIKVLAYGAVTNPARELAAAFTQETGDQVTFTFGSPGPVNERLNA